MWYILTFIFGFYHKKQVSKLGKNKLLWKQYCGSDFHVAIIHSASMESLLPLKNIIRLHKKKFYSLSEGRSISENNERLKTTVFRSCVPPIRPWVGKYPFSILYKTGRKSNDKYQIPSLWLSRVHPDKGLISKWPLNLISTRKKYSIAAITKEIVPERTFVIGFLLALRNGLN